MTVENAIKLLATYKHRIELQGADYAESKPDGRGRDSAERASILRVSTKALAEMKQYILTSKKFDGNPIRAELQPAPKKETKVKQDGKKSKR